MLWEFLLRIHVRTVESHLRKKIWDTRTGEWRKWKQVDKPDQTLTIENSNSIEFVGETNKTELKYCRGENMGCMGQITKNKLKIK